jgi:hypothetical protein
VGVVTGMRIVTGVGVVTGVGIVGVFGPVHGTTSRRYPTGVLSGRKRILGGRPCGHRESPRLIIP